MNLVTFLDDLRNRNISLWSKEGRLRYEAKRDPITPEDLELLREHKTTLLPLVLTEEELMAARRIESWNRSVDKRQYGGRKK